MDRGPRASEPARRLVRPDPAAVPAPVRAILARLRDDGHEAVLVGGCVRDLLRGLAVSDFDVATSADPDRVLARFPRAVPIGIRHGTVMVPSQAGPVDVTTFRAGAHLTDDLAHRDFTVNAIAWDPLADRWIDPHQGARDLAAGRLRGVGSAAGRFAEDPLRALRAARLVATLGLAPDAEIEPAMRAAREPLRAVARERVRQELSALLMAPGVARGLRLLRSSGLEAELAPGTREDAPEVVAALPPRLLWRLAGWLRGTRAEAILAGLRFGRRSARAVSALLARHPIDAAPSPRDADLRRLLRRLGDEGADALLALRRAEIAAAASADPAGAATARATLDALAARLERVRAAGSLALQRSDLALDGRAVMRLFGLPPGPRVGEALAFLAECVIEDPSSNTPEALAERLRAWFAARSR